MIEGQICNELESLQHRLFNCQSIKPATYSVKSILELFVAREISENQMLTLSFTHRKKSTRFVAVWFVIKALHLIFRSSHLKSEEILSEMLSEISQNLSIIGSRSEMGRLANIIGAKRNQQPNLSF